jgi:hypothetical protein
MPPGSDSADRWIILKGFSNLRSISYIVFTGVVRLQKADHATVGEGEAVDRVCKASYGDVAVISRF